MYLLHILLLSISILTAGVIHVPSDQPNIQAGINWASPGDTVLVSSGTYTGTGNYSINFYGKGIHLLSESGPDNTMIDLQGDRRGFFFDTNEDTTTIVEGFEVRNGYVCRDDSYYDSDYHNGYGGAVYINQSYPKFVNMKFQYNDAKYRGSGIYITDGGNAIFEDCYFQDNEYNYDSSNEGGAVAIYNANATFRNTTFYNNGNDSHYRGGAIWIYSNSDDNDYYVDIDDCTFLNNGASGGDAFGGAIYIYEIAVSIDDSYFFQNDANEQGGALYIASNSRENIYIDNCDFIDNGHHTNQGGAIYKHELGDTLFVDNSAFRDNGYDTSQGGAIYLNRTKAVINNSEITGNRTYSSNEGNGIFVRGDYWNDNDEYYRNYFEMNFSTVVFNYYNHNNYNVGTSIRFQYNDCNAVINNSIISYSTTDGATTNQNEYPYIEFNNTYTDGQNYRNFINHHKDWREFDLAAHAEPIGYAEYDSRFPNDKNGNPRPLENPDAGCYESTRTEPESSSTTIYVSTNGSDETGSGEQDNPYASVYKGVRASHYDFNDVIEIEAGVYEESQEINLRGRRVHVRGASGSDQTELIFPGERSFTMENYSWSQTFPTGHYEHTLEGLDIKLNSSTDYGIYMEYEGINLIDMIVEDEIYAYRAEFDIDGLTSHTSENFWNSSLIFMEKESDNEDHNYYFNNLDISTGGHTAIRMRNEYENWRDMNVYITNSTLRSSNGSGDVIGYSCCGGHSNEDRIYIQNSFIHGDIDHRALRDFYAYRTVFKDTRFDISWDYSNNSNDFQMENCVVDNGYFYMDSDGLVKNTIFYPNIEYQYYSGDQSNLEFQYSMNIPDDAPDIGVYNIAGDPIFVDVENENYNLMPTSPCIDMAHIDNDGDGNIWSSDSDDQDPDGTRLDMGVFYFDQQGAYEPIILSVSDVEDDQGGALQINWAPSPSDVENGNISHYGVWRVTEDGLDGLSMIPAIQDTMYSYISSTINDFYLGDENLGIEDDYNYETYVISAHTPNTDLFYISEPDSGYSVDNILPHIPDGFEMSTNNNFITLSWEENTDEDFDHYEIFRNGEFVVAILETDYTELNFGDLTYHIVAVDINGNHSQPTQSLEVSLYEPGDVTLDGDINVFDVILIVEYILDEESSDFTDLELGLADHNFDGSIDIMDVISWVNQILDLRISNVISHLDVYKNSRELLLESGASGIGFEVVISHDKIAEPNFECDAFVCDYVTNNGSTHLIILSPNSEFLFKTDVDFEVSSIIVASSEGYVESSLIQVPDQFSVSKAYPNPFNPATNISIELPEQSHLSMKVYDLSGRVVDVISDEMMSAGSHSMTWNASRFPSGVYIINTVAGNFSNSQQITLIK